MDQDLCKQKAEEPSELFTAGEDTSAKNPQQVQKNS